MKWVSEDIGDGEGYDILSFSHRTGESRLLEVKTTNGPDRTPFYISRNELTVSQEHKENWRLFRLFSFSQTPKAFKLRPPLESHVELCPNIYKAGFDSSGLPPIT